MTAGKISELFGLKVVRDMTLAGYGSLMKGSALKYLDQVSQNTIVENF